jgi:hypothetical protein
MEFVLFVYRLAGADIATSAIPLLEALHLQRHYMEYLVEGTSYVLPGG